MGKLPKTAQGEPTKALPQRTTEYIASDALVVAVEDAIFSPLPFFIRQPIKLVLPGTRARAMKFALEVVIPGAISVLLLHAKEGDTLALTKDGSLEERFKKNLLRRIALWLTPNEVPDLIFRLHEEVVQMGRDVLTTPGWGMSVVEGEVTVTVLDTSLIRESADTVIDLFFDSIDAVSGMKDRVIAYFSKKK